MEPICLEDLEKIAQSKWSSSIRGYYSSGSNHEETLKDNYQAFSRIRIRPRFLSEDISSVNLSSKILGYQISMPIGTSPTAMQKMAHPDGEIATAKACMKSKMPMILSTISTSSVEEVSHAAPEGMNFFQLYIYKQRDLTVDLLKRVEKLGYKAIVLTVDAPFFGIRFADVRNKFSLPNHLRIANFVAGDPASESLKYSIMGSGINDYVTKFFDSSITWKDVKWLKSVTRLPIIVKGILTREDALLAIEHGVNGIMVSNHGARQLDSVQATIDALPEVIEAVNGRVEVYLDGGIRNGTDVFKALALGAKAVFIGRPVLWGLTYKGEEGVMKLFDILRKELSMAMALSGCSNIQKIDKKYVTKPYFYNSNL